MKARIKWTKTGVLKFIGHLDVQRYFHKAMMRAGLPVSFSQGMSPHQIMSFAAPLGMGMTSEGEYADITFDWSYRGQEMVDRMNAVMNEGISVTRFRRIEDREKNCMAVTAACDYRIGFRKGHYFTEPFLKRTQMFAMQEEIMVMKKTKRSEKIVDISPMILDIHTEEGGEETIFLKTVAGSSQNLRPQTVMEAFCNYLGYDYDPAGFTIHRLETYLEREGRLLPLDSVGWEVTEPVIPEEESKQ